MFIVDRKLDQLERAGTLIRVVRRAWHLGPMAFMVSRRRGHELSAYESQLIGLLAANKPGGKNIRTARTTKAPRTRSRSRR